MYPGFFNTFPCVKSTPGHASPGSLNTPVLVTYVDPILVLRVLPVMHHRESQLTGVGYMCRSYPCVKSNPGHASPGSLNTLVLVTWVTWVDPILVLRVLQVMHHRGVSIPCCWLHASTISLC